MTSTTSIGPPATSTTRAHPSASPSSDARDLEGGNPPERAAETIEGFATGDDSGLVAIVVLEQLRVLIGEIDRDSSVVASSSVNPTISRPSERLAAYSSARR